MRCHNSKQKSLNHLEKRLSPLSKNAALASVSIRLRMGSSIPEKHYNWVHYSEMKLSDVQLSCLSPNLKVCIANSKPCLILRSRHQTYWSILQASLLWYNKKMTAFSNLRQSKLFRGVQKLLRTKYAKPLLNIKYYVKRLLFTGA